MSTPAIQTPDNELLAAAEALAKLLDISSLSVETLLGKDKQRKRPEVKIHSLPTSTSKLSEYILIRETHCSTCSTTLRRTFHMQKRNSVLIAVPIDPQIAPTLPVSTEISNIRTCPSCMENLLLLQKEDLALLYLELINSQTQPVQLVGFYELEEKFTKLHPAVKRREV